MPFTLPALPYAYEALEPHVDALTMRIHHDKHHAAYVDNLNKALAAYPELQSRSLDELLKGLEMLPQAIRPAVRNNGGGHYNHTLFWEIMKPGGPVEPAGVLAEAIKKKFGTVDDMKAAISDAGMKRFGSGWSWLMLDGGGELMIASTANQDSPISEGHKPLLGIDVWEHAYYLKYQNMRANYLAAWWKVVNWDEVAARYEKLRV